MKEKYPSLKCGRKEQHEIDFEFSRRWEGKPGLIYPTISPSTFLDGLVGHARKARKLFGSLGQPKTIKTRSRNYRD